MHFYTVVIHFLIHFLICLFSMCVKCMHNQFCHVFLNEKLAVSCKHVILQKNHKSPKLLKRLFFTIYNHLKTHLLVFLAVTWVKCMTNLSFNIFFIFFLSKSFSIAQVSFCIKTNNFNTKWFKICFCTFWLYIHLLTLHTMVAYSLLKLIFSVLKWKISSQFKCFYNKNIHISKLPQNFWLQYHILKLHSCFIL